MTYRALYLEAGFQVWLVVVFFLALVSFCLFLIISSSKRLNYSILLSCTVFCLILAKDQFLLMVGLWCIALLLFFVATIRIKKEKQSRISIDVFFILKRGIPIVMTALSLLIAGGFYFSLVEKQKLSTVPRIEIKIPISFTTKTLNVVRFVVPAEELLWIQKGMTVDEYVEKTIQRNKTMLKSDGQKILKNAISDGDARLSDVDEMFEASGQELIENGRDALSIQLGVSLDGTEQMVLIVNQLLEKRLEEFINGETTDAALLPIGAALAVLVLLKTVSWFLGFVVLWTTSVIFSILVRLKTIEIRKENKEVEVIV